jgi:hypothetical protein
MPIATVAGLPRRIGTMSTPRWMRHGPCMAVGDLETAALMNSLYR